MRTRPTSCSCHDATAQDWLTIFSHAEVRHIGGRPRARPGRRGGPRDHTCSPRARSACACRATRAPFKSIDAPSVLGELAFFDAYPRSATLDAVTDVEVVRLDEAAFDRLLENAPELANAMMRDLARILALRLRMASEVIADLRGG